MSLDLFNGFLMEVGIAQPYNTIHILEDISANSFNSTPITSINFSFTALDSAGTQYTRSISWTGTWYPYGSSGGAPSVLIPNMIWPFITKADIDILALNGPISASLTYTDGYGTVTLPGYGGSLYVGPYYVYPEGSGSSGTLVGIYASSTSRSGGGGGGGY